MRGLRPSPAASVPAGPFAQGSGARLPVSSPAGHSLGAREGALLLEKPWSPALGLSTPSARLQLHPKPTAVDGPGPCAPVPTGAPHQLGNQALSVHSLENQVRLAFPSGHDWEATRTVLTSRLPTASRPLTCSSGRRILIRKGADIEASRRAWEQETWGTGPGAWSPSGTALY